MIGLILYNSHPTVISLNSFQAKSVHEQVLEWTQNERSSFQSITSVTEVQSSRHWSLHSLYIVLVIVCELRDSRAWLFQGTLEITC